MEKMRHYWKSVPGWAAFHNLYINMVARAPMDRPSTFVEIGSWAGRSAALMGVEIINSGKPITLHCIDPWVDGGPDLSATEHWKGMRDHKLIDLFRRNTKPVSSVIRMHHGLSEERYVDFEDYSIDFLMVDGLHTYEAVKQDIALYTPKMKHDGIMSGDDYTWPGVKQAVDEAFGKNAQITYLKRDAKGNYKLEASFWAVAMGEISGS